MHVRAALVAAMSFCLFTACSSERGTPSAVGSDTVSTGAESSDPTVGSSDPATSAPARSDPPATDPAVTDPPLPNGTMEVEASSLGVTFAVPETYTVLDPAQLGDDFYRGAAFEELAARTGLAVEDFERLLKEVIELYVFAPAAAEGFVDNINVADVPTPELPSAEQLEQTFTALGVQNLTIEPGTQRGLDYLQSVYELPIGDRVVYGNDLHILVDGRPVEITATAATRETADDLGALVLDTVAPS